MRLLHVRSGGSVFVAALALLGILALLAVLVAYYRSSRPTIVTSALNGDLPAVKRFLAEGVSIDSQDPLRFGWTPLIASIFSRAEGVATYLIEHGADINRLSLSGDTALVMAITVGATNTVERLLMAGASLSIPGGGDAYSAAQVGGQKEAMLAILDRYRKKKAED